MAESLLDNVKALPFEVRQYMLITGNYWAFTITDGALRMLVVMYFHQLGYSPLQIAMLFLFYEAFGVVTNLVGGWLGARLGLNRTMNVGLGLQIVALAMLMVPAGMLTVVWVMWQRWQTHAAPDEFEFEFDPRVFAFAIVPIDFTKLSRARCCLVLLYFQSAAFFGNLKMCLRKKSMLKNMFCFS